MALSSIRQVMTFPVWSNAIPGSINTINYLEEEITKDKQLQSTSQVTIPNLSMYLPKKNSTIEVQSLYFQEAVILI